MSTVFITGVVIIIIASMQTVYLMMWPCFSSPGRKCEYSEEQGEVYDEEEYPEEEYQEEEGKDEAEDPQETTVE